MIDELSDSSVCVHSKNVQESSQKYLIKDIHGKGDGRANQLGISTLQSGGRGRIILLMLPLAHVILMLGAMLIDHGVTNKVRTFESALERC